MIDQSLLLRTLMLASTLAVASSATLGCAGADDVGGEQVAMQGAAVLDGTPADEERFEAVGALVYYLPEIGVLDVFCTATLIDHKAVVTARHCTPSIDVAFEIGMLPAIAFGQDAFSSTHVVPITGYVAAPAGPAGLLLDGGRDVAVAYLESKPEGIEPAKLGQFDDDMLGDKFKIAGYGVYDTTGIYGQKYRGRVTARALKGKWYSLLFNGDYDAYLEWYFTDSPFAAPSEAEAKEWWKVYKLESKYELYAGGLSGDANPCYGDSGGPLFQRSHHNITVYGVSFAVEGSISNVCDFGGGYLVFNRQMLKFVRDAL